MLFVICPHSTSLYMQKRPSDFIKNEENKTLPTTLHNFLLPQIQSLCLKGSICHKTREIQNLSDVLNSALKKEFNLKKPQSM